jgi:hypothetical protein
MFVLLRIREVMTIFQVKQSLPPTTSDGLVGIHHKLIGEPLVCSGGLGKQKKKKKILGQC